MIYIDKERRIKNNAGKTLVLEAPPSRCSQEGPGSFLHRNGNANGRGLSLATPWAHFVCSELCKDTVL